MKPVRDFGFSTLPPVREIPESAANLGHRAVSIYGGWSPVMSKPTAFGYSFSEGTYTDEGVRLDWTVSAQLWAVSERGAELQEVDREELRIGRLHGGYQPDIYVDPPKGRYGFYRYDMQIANESGTRLGSYSAYFKVVRPSWKPRLQLSRNALQPGQRLLARLDNYGTEVVSFVEAFSVQRAEGAEWVAVDLPRRRWRMWLGQLGPGASSRCNELILPAEIPHGTYRIVKRAGTERWPEGKSTQVTALFEVVGPGAGIFY
jgi:hypothetical protein